MLRSLIIAGALLAPFCVLAADPTGGSKTDAVQTTEKPEVRLDFAPGAKGAFEGTDIEGRYFDATRNPEKYWPDLKTLPPADIDISDGELDAMRERALNNPRVRKLLGIDGQGTEHAQAGQERYADTTLFVFVSTNMPDASLRATMIEARRYGVAVIMRGFVNNSVVETQKRLVQIFGSLEEISGFSIDPTLFERFDVEAVPVLVGIDDSLGACETMGCKGDPLPLHDRVSGNTPIKFALETIGRNGDVAAAAAKLALANPASGQGGQQ